MRFRPGERIGPYTLVSPLSEGGQAEVWRATRPPDRPGGRPVERAVRVSWAGGLGRAPRVLRSVEHDHVVRVYACEVYDGQQVTEMDLVAGVTVQWLLERLREKGARAPLDAVRELGLGACGGLEALHRAPAGGEGVGQGLVHQDIKPANLMIREDGRPVIIDLGSAYQLKPPEQTYTEMHGQGTLLYMAPEQQEGDRVDGRADLYALGMVLFELATGEPIFEGRIRVPEQKREDRPRQRVRERRERLGSLAEPLERALASAPADRPANALELARALASAPVPRGPGLKGLLDAVRGAAPPEALTQPDWRALAERFEGVHWPRGVVPRADPPAESPFPEPLVVDRRWRWGLGIAAVIPAPLLLVFGLSSSAPPPPVTPEPLAQVAAPAPLPAPSSPAPEEVKPPSAARAPVPTPSCSAKDEDRDKHRVAVPDSPECRDRLKIKAADPDDRDIQQPDRCELEDADSDLCFARASSPGCQAHLEKQARSKGFTPSCFESPGEDQP